MTVEESVPGDSEGAGEREILLHSAVRLILSPLSWLTSPGQKKSSRQLPMPVYVTNMR